jgi:hypothetical protein
MKILLWTKHPGDLLGQAIDALTHGNAQHAGFLRSNGLIHEAYYPLVRDREVQDDEKQFIRVFRLDNLPIELEPKFERLFDLNIQAGVEYSFANLFRFQFNLEMPSAQTVICSQYVFHCISLCAPMSIPLIRCEEDQVSPRDLLISPRLIEESWPNGENTP